MSEYHHKKRRVKKKVKEIRNKLIKCPNCDTKIYFKFIPKNKLCLSCKNQLKKRNEKGNYK